MSPALTKKQSKAARIVELERKLVEALAGQAHVYHFAVPELRKCTEQRFTGSGVVMTLTALGGRAIFLPVLFRDGLSQASIDALVADMERSYALATLYKPGPSNTTTEAKK